MNKDVATNILALGYASFQKVTLVDSVDGERESVRERHTHTATEK